MNSLIEIIAVLKPSECRAVEKVLRTQSQGSRRLDLFRLIAQDQLKTDTQLAQALYGKNPNSAYSHLKTRLYHNILEIIFPDNLPRVEGVAEQLRFECGRKILLAQLFIAREAHINAAQTLVECRVIALEAHLHAELLMIHDMLMQLQQFCPIMDEPPADPALMHTSVMTLSEGLAVKQATLELDQLLEQENIMPASIPAEVHRLAAHWAARPDHDDPQIAFWALRLQILSARAEQNQGLALQLGHRLESFISRVHLALPDQIMATLDIARLQFIGGQEEAARRRIQGAFDEVGSHSVFALLALEFFFLMDMYAGDHEAAAQRLEQARTHPKRQIAAFNAAKWQYYEACLAHVQCNWHHSLALIADNKELFKYKSKWLLGLKLLEIYNFLAMGKHDLVEYKMNALKQLLKRQKHYDIRRCKHICKVLASLVRATADHGSAAIPPERVTMQHWSPFNFEIIDLHKWISRQASFNPVLA